MKLLLDIINSTGSVAYKSLLRGKNEKKDFIMVTFTGSDWFNHVIMFI